jgi:hypothetical protein
MKQPVLKLVMALCGVMVSGALHAAIQTPPPGSWDAFNSFRVSVAQSQTKDGETFQGRLDRKLGDLQVEVDRSKAEHHENGSAMLVAGKILAYQGKLGVPAGQEGGIPTEALLHHVMAMHLLAAVFPEGYAALEGTRQVEHAEPGRDLSVVIADKQDILQAPWKISGSVERVSESRLAYRFQVISGNKKTADAQHPYRELRYEGEAALSEAPVLEDATALADWKLPNFQPPAIPGVADGVKTVGDVRTVLATWALPGKKDPSRNFAGMWRMNCNQPAGMRITQYGEDGIYAISMCLKDRCVPEARTQKSFINGDVKYAILGNDAIDFLTIDGRRDHYLRCQ